MKHLIFLILFISSFNFFGQNVIKMKTPRNAEIKFENFLKKKKFGKEDYYSGILDKDLLIVCEKNINEVAKAFRKNSQLENPTENEYQKIIKNGLLKFNDVYFKLDSEDLDRVCNYFEEIMDIVELKSSNGKLNKFRYWFDPNEIKKMN